MTNHKPQMALLEDRGVIRVSGSDAAHFLNGLVSNGVESMRDFSAITHSALLTPQGKILFAQFVWKWDAEFYLDCPRDSVAELIKRLTFYRLRAKVEITDVSADLAIAAIWDGAIKTDPTDDIMLLRDPRSAAMGWRLLAHPATLADFAHQPAGFATHPVGLEDYHAHRIACSICEFGHDFKSGEVFPHEANFDKLHGVDFKKGCYVGQEVVSRMQHRGTARARYVQVRSSVGLPEPGSELRAGEVPIGTLSSRAGNIGLALVRLDRWQKARSAGHGVMAVLGASATEVEIILPEWLDLAPLSSDSEAS